MTDRNTIQKQIIHRTLCEMGGHPTAAVVYARVRQEHPTISRSTVYRVLGRMAQDGKILRLELGGSDSRYDGRLEPHDHLYCRMCGAVEDIPPVDRPERPSEARGFLVEDCAVIYRGLCPACREGRTVRNSYAGRRL